VTLGGLAWHAENEVQFLEESRSYYAAPWQFLAGRDLVTLSGGNVVKLLKQSGGTNLFLTILDGDGNIVAAPLQYGPVDSAATMGPKQQIAALADGGFMVVWYESNNTSVENRLYFQSFDADGTARETPLAMFQNPAGIGNQLVDYSITALDDGRTAVLANFNASDYQRAFVVEGDGSAASLVGTTDDPQMRFHVIAAVAKSDGFTRLTIDEEVVGPSQRQDLIVVTDFIENSSTGALEQQASRILLTLPAGSANEVLDVVYTRLGSDDLAAFWKSGSDNKLYLLTEIGGIASSTAVSLPFDSTGNASISSVSASEAGDGGARVTAGPR